MSKPYVLYGWTLSYFTGKVACYLRYKGVPFIEKPMDLYTLMVRGPRKTHARVMPILVSPEGEWLQDSSVIMDTLEKRFPGRPVVPATPMQRTAAYLLEMWGDEWWIPTAMHTRWSYPENYVLFEREAGDSLLPGFPRPFKNRAAAYVASTLRDFQKTVGFVPEQHGTLNRWTETMLDHLDRHFAQQPYLLGDRPSLGDFGLAGPMVAHLGRDPWPKQHLIAPRPHLQAWIERMAQPPATPGGDFLAGDRIPDSLSPVLAAIAREFLPMLAGILDQARRFMAARPDRARFPRGLGLIEFPMGEGRFQRAALPYSLWMVQRLQDVHAAMSVAEQSAARAWLASFGAEQLLEMKVPRLQRIGLHVALEYAA